MTLYARSDLRSVTVGGGCGEQHVADGKTLILDCADCEAAIEADPRLRRLWSDDQDNPVLTEAEEALRRRMQEREDRVEAQRRLLVAEQRAAAPPVPASAVVQAEESEDLNDLHVQTLRKMARDRELDDSGTKAELIERLSKDV